MGNRIAGNSLQEEQMAGGRCSRAGAAVKPASHRTYRAWRSSTIDTKGNRAEHVGNDKYVGYLLLKQSLQRGT